MQSNYPIVSPNYQIDIDQQYADDISKTSTSISAIEKMKDELPVKLVLRRLKTMNQKQKLLGSLLDTQNGIKK